jgi:predicted GH43/DUF377 family glycosyl hydrolase
LRSPIELDEGWLLLTHGVGPVRRYSIGAVLLDKADPAGFSHARTSLWYDRNRPIEKAMCPMSSTHAAACGHNDRVILPYAVSDTFCSVATMRIAALLDSLQS